MWCRRIDNTQVLGWNIWSAPNCHLDDTGVSSGVIIYLKTVYYPSTWALSILVFCTLEIKNFFSKNSYTSQRIKIFHLT